MTYSNDTHLAEEDTSHGYLECPDDAIVDASANATVTLTFTAPEGTAIPADTLVRVGDPDACPEHGAVVFATDAAASVEVGKTSVDVAAKASFHHAAEHLLGRMVDPTDPEASLRQEVELVGIEGILEEAARWLRPGEVLAPDFEADVRLVVSMLDTSSTTRD